MTDNEIIKAFECCEANGGDRPDCDNCPFTFLSEHDSRCFKKVRKQVLDLINRQKAENERLQKENEILSANADNAFQEGLNESRELFKEEVEKGIKAEAFKEFAERLCKDRVSNDPVVIAVKVELKTAGEENGKI